MSDAAVIPPSSTPTGPMPPQQKSIAKRLAMLLLKVIVAVLAIWFVARLVHWNDTAIVSEGKSIRNLTFVHETEVVVVSKEVQPAVGAAAAPPEATYLVKFPATVEVTVEGLKPGERLKVTIDDGNRVKFNLPRELVLPESVFKAKDGVVVQPGLRSLLSVAKKKWYLLVAAWAILVIPFLVTAVRWRNLMRPQGITGDAAAGRVCG